jgi:hypothetical protein
VLGPIAKSHLVTGFPTSHLQLAVLPNLGLFPHLTDDELCRQDPCSKLLTLASLPCQGFRMLVEGRHAAVHAAENPSRTDRKYYAFHPSYRKSPIT